MKIVKKEKDKNGILLHVDLFYYRNRYSHNKNIKILQWYVNNNPYNMPVNDINIIRERAGVPLIQGTSTNQMLLVIENERRMELCFEGHRWYDLIRTGRANTIMDEFTSNWTEKDELWPIPLREITNNPSLKNAQNPGY